MSLSVILGKSNTGKSEYLYKKIMACENEKKQAILFVPPQARLIAEEEYLKYTNKKAIIDTKITDIERFVSQNLDKKTLYKEKTYLPDMAKKMLIKKIIGENPDLFKVFNKVKDTVGFTNKVADYFVKLQDVQAETFLDKYDEEDFLKLKLEEFVNIYNKIEDNLKTRFITSIDELKAYINYLSNNEKVLNADFFIDGYNNFSNAEYEFIYAILKSNNNVSITLDIDKEKYLNETTQIYNTSYDTLAKLKELAIKAGVKFEIVNLKDEKHNTKKDISYLANNLFDVSKNTYTSTVDNVKLVLMPNTYEEIKYVAEDILKNVINGYRFSDMAIYTNNIETYSVYLKKVMDKYNIPIHIKEKTSLINNNLTRYLLTVLELVTTDFTKSIDKAQIMLKTGLLDVEEVDIYLFENYILEFGVKGYNLKKELTLNSNYDLEKINNVRAKILDEIELLRSNLNKKKDAYEITNVIYNYLKDSNIIQRYEASLSEIKQIDINEYNKNRQVVQKLYEVMDNICLAYSECELEEYLELLDYGISIAKIDTIPAKFDEVEIIDINKNKSLDKKIGYVLGCYDGGLPSTQSEDSIFTDIELEKLKFAGIDLKQTSEERNNMQLFNIYKVLNKVREKLTFTVPSSLSSGTSLRPSSIISDIKKLLDIKLDGIQEVNYSNIDENFMEFLSSIMDMSDDTCEDELKELYDKYIMYSQMDKYKKIMDYIRKDSNLEKDTLDKIYKNTINSSVSKLEQFKRCPFAYFNKYVLKLNLRKKHVMSSLDMGSLMHEIIEKFSKYIISKNIMWQDIVLDEKKNMLAKAKIDEIVDKIFEEEYGKYLTEARYVVLKNKLKKAITRTIMAIADSFNHSEFRPLGYEITFDNDSIFAPIEVVLDNGKKILLKGKIDRIDSCKLEDKVYLRIVDYKSSDKNLKLSDVKEGISLQLMTYMCAMLENKDKVDSKSEVFPAALSYFTVTNKILNIPNFEDDDHKITEKIKKALKLRGIYIKDLDILKKLDNNVENSKESYLEVSKRTINNEEKVLEQNVFVEECKNVRKILKSIAEEVVKGTVKICPNSNITGVCDFCDYSTVCRKNILN